MHCCNINKSHRGNFFLVHLVYVQLRSVNFEIKRICYVMLWMRQIVGFGNRVTGRGNFGGKYGAPHCNQWGLLTIGNSHCAAEQLLLSEFLELHARRASEPSRFRRSARCG